ncbi:phosphotransferase [Phycicoccus sonneratiae]|uniref:Phosphotransferase n=1 Tax=Phycicoccus sonneratiae TaxID=2807628 RepID=A0ABS2CJX6_9MICO|nr:phosphotransferase [Phycicoccus sonneraticus]MBM6399384.1 phosphotransferase [Phycicoccus sonneraticus]
MRRIHDDEADTSPATLRALVATVPGWADLPLHPVGATGTDHVVQRLGDGLVLRVPRKESAARSLLDEVGHLRHVAPHVPVPVPEVVHVGAPTAGYPYTWAVLRWLGGSDAWAARRELEDPRGERLAADLAGLVLALRAAPPLPVPRRNAGQRGGPLQGVLERSERWLSGSDGPLPAWVDVDAVRHLVHRSRSAAHDEVPYVLTHGDLIPGNVLVDGARLAAVIDWGYGSLADPALDLVAGWSLLGPAARAVFREAVGADDATWERARANALEQALGGVVYYTPRRHPLADVMGRTLRRLLDETHP